MNKVEHQNEHFSSISEEYYEARQNKNHLFFKSLLFGYMLKDFLTDRKETLLVLEPMCGYGEGRSIVSKYITENIEYEGFDYSDILIEKVHAENPEVKIYKQDVTTFKSEKKYDIVILLGGLHHVPEYAETVCKSLSDSLKPGGLFINFEPTNNCGLIAKIREIIYKRNHIFDEQTEHDFSLKELNNLYHNAGMKIVKQFYPGLLAYVLYYNPDAFPKLNLGGIRTINFLFRIERNLYTSILGKVFSFCTFSILTR